MLLIKKTDETIEIEKQFKFSRNVGKRRGNRFNRNDATFESQYVG